MLEKRTTYKNLLNTIQVYNEMAVTGEGQINKKELMHICYKEYDNKRIELWQLKVLLDEINE